MKANGFLVILQVLLLSVINCYSVFSIGQWRDIKPTQSSNIRITDKDNHKWDGYGYSYRVVVPISDDHKVNVYARKGYNVAFRMRLKYHEEYNGTQYAFFEVQQKSGKTTIKYSNKLAHGGDNLAGYSLTYYLGQNLQKGVNPLPNAQNSSEEAGIKVNFPIDGPYTNIIMMFGAEGFSTDDWIIDDLAIQYMIIEPERPPFTNGRYQISTLEHLLYVSCFASDYSYIDILNDIDASQTKVWYEGSGFPAEKKYKRVDVNGNNHTISGLTINQPDKDSVGLFKAVDNLIVDNLKISDATINGRKYVGTLCGNAKSSSINNCQINATVTGNNCVGGMIGGIDNSLSVSNATIHNLLLKGSSYIGGISGSASSATISQTTVNVNVVGDNYVGGLLGRSSNSKSNASTIRLCIVQGSVEGKESYTGGLVGSLTNGLIYDTSADISVTGKDFVGGLIGSLTGTYKFLDTDFKSELHRSYNNKDVVASGDGVGGLVGDCYHSNISDCFSHINVTGNDKVGGLIGKVRAATGWGNSVYPCEIRNSYSLGTVTGNTQNKGGIIGWGYSFEGRYAHYKVNGTYCLAQEGLNDIGQPLSIEEFNNMEYFQKWDFATVWIMETLNDFRPGIKLPYLHCQFKDKMSSVFFSVRDERGVTLKDYVVTFPDNNLSLRSEKYPQLQVNLYPGTYSYNVSAPFPFKEIKSKQLVIHNPKERLYICDTLSCTSVMPELNAEGIYEITTIENLLWLSQGNFDDDANKKQQRLNASYKLVSDIDATDTKTWNPDNDGNFQGFLPIKDFNGSFDGNGYSISDLYIQNSKDSYCGLFATIKEDALVKDLAIINASVSGSSCGILAYENKGNISNVFVSGILRATNNMGGLVAQNYGSICSGAAVVTLGAPGDTVSIYAGGLVAINNGAKIDKSYAYAQINAKAKSTPNDIGGLAGYASRNSILRSYYLEGTGSNTNGTPLTPAQFGDSLNFIDWDFQVIWKIGRCEQINQANLPYFFYMIDDNIKEITFECKNKNNEVLPGAHISVFSKKVITNSQGRAYMKLPVGSYSANVVAPVYKRSSANAFGLNENKILELILDSIQYQSGTGTLESPFLIAEMEHLRRLFENRQDWDKHFRLSNNINAEETKDWEKRKYNMTIGDTQTPFTGKINGCMYEISNLNLITPIDTLGMFGVVKNATISNLKLQNHRIQGKRYVAGLASFASGSEINNILIQNSEIEGESNIAGLVYECSKSTLDSISLSIRVQSSLYGNTAGLIGVSTNDMIRRVHAQGDVSGYYNSSSYSAGLVAEANDETTVMNSYSSVSVSYGNAGGLIGSLSGKLDNVYFCGSVYPGSDKKSGGISAVINSTAVVDKAYSTVKNTRNAAISSSVHSSAKLTDVYWDKDNSGQSDFIQINQTSGMTSEEFSSFDKWPTGDKVTSVWCLGKDKDDYIRPLLSWSSIPILYHNIEKVKDNSFNPLYYTGNSDVRLKNPIACDGYYYNGLYEDADYTTSISRIPAGSKEAVNVWIKCTPISYNIYYYLNGGVNHADNPVDYTIEDRKSVLPPSKDGYEFGGWFSDPLFQSPADIVIENKSGHLQYHALWQIATGCSDEEESQNIKVHPNPATSVLYIKCTQGSAIELFNNSGIKIIELESDDNIEKIDISSYQRGLYFLKVNGKSYKLIFR